MRATENTARTTSPRPKTRSSSRTEGERQAEPHRLDLHVLSDENSAAPSSGAALSDLPRTIERFLVGLRGPGSAASEWRHQRVVFFVEEFLLFFVLIGIKHRLPAILDRFTEDATQDPPTPPPTITTRRDSNGSTSQLRGRLRATRCAA